MWRFPRTPVSRGCGRFAESLEDLHGRLSVRNEGCVVAAQEAPPSPVFLRNGHGRSASVPVPPSSVNGLGERWIETLEPLHSRSEDENDPSMIIDDLATAGKPAATSARKLTFLQNERWKAIQKARREGGCNFEQSSVKWESTGAQSRNTWRRRDPRRDNPG